MGETIVIHGIKYQAVDKPTEKCNLTCKDCDIYKNSRQLPLCCEDKYKKVIHSCCEQFKNGIKRIWKKI